LGIAGTSILYLSGRLATAGQQQGQRDTEQGQRDTESSILERSDMKSKQLWSQIARLHSRIVAIELNENGSRSSRAGRTDPAVERSDQESDGQNPARTAFGGSNAKTEQLWMQLAQVHKQIVAKQANEGERRTTFFRGEPQNRDRFSAERDQQTDRDPSNRASQVGSPRDPLWERYVQLQQQIIAADVKEAETSSGTPDSAETGNR
jgi:hypothetical protein